jgi:threonyl-tRNA synthetase
VREALLDAGLRVEANLKDDRVGYKIREASLQKVPYVIVVGAQEQEGETVNVRSRDRGEIGEMALEGFLQSIADEREGAPPAEPAS